jgi:hypothetical protein
MNGWNKKRTENFKFFKLNNGQWLKIIFSYANEINVWFMTICVANSKRQCNDCTRKTEFSPKIFYGHITGNRLGLEALMISLRSLLEFEKTIKNCEIRIVGASDRLTNIYKRLTKYGYSVKTIKYSNGKEKEIIYKMV